MNAGEVINRLKTITNTKNDAELARRLGKNPTVVYTWRSRNTLNHEVILRYFWEEDLNYIYKGLYVSNKIKEEEKLYSKTENEIANLKAQIDTLKEIIIKIKTTKNNDNN